MEETSEAQTPGMYIRVRGARRTGRTERMLWIAAGAILAGGRPSIATRTKPDYDQTRERLMIALRQVGFDPLDSAVHARRAVSWPGGREMRGATFRLLEVDT